MQTNWLNLAAGLTVFFLLIGAVLVGVGIFDEHLDWDIFPRAVEKALMGVFYTAIFFGLFGGAITCVLGIQAGIRHLGRIQQALAKEAAPVEAQGRKTLAWVALIAGGFTILILLLAGINHAIHLQRCRVFKQVAAAQLANLSNQLTPMLAAMRESPRAEVSQDLYDFMRQMAGLSFVENALLYLPDPRQEHALWVYSPHGEYRKDRGFERFLVARDDEKALQAAFAGNTEALEKLNAQSGVFLWYAAIPLDGKPLAILRLAANRSTDFRSYRL